MSAEDAVTARAELARTRAARARQSATRAEDAAYRQEALAERTGREVFACGAVQLRRSAKAQRTSAELQDSYARRLLECTRRTGAAPPFMAGVAEVCGVPSAALILVGSDRSQLAIATSDEPSRAVGELEFVLGEGPATDAVVLGEPVLAVGRELVERWPGVGPALAGLGLGAVQAVPISGGSPESCLGALSVFGGRPAPQDRVAECAEGLVGAVLLGADADPELYGDLDHRAVVHQAAGMLAVRLSRPVTDALALIKARAWAEGSTAGAIAERIVNEGLELRLEQP
jgi:hypothetical protein